MVVLLAFRRRKRVCAHCGRDDLGGREVAAGAHHGRYLCRPLKPGIMNCFNLVSVYHHDQPCRVCAAAFPSAFADNLFPIAGPRNATVWSHKG